MLERRMLNPAIPPAPPPADPRKVVREPSPRVLASRAAVEGGEAWCKVELKEGWWEELEELKKSILLEGDGGSRREEVEGRRKRVWLSPARHLLVACEREKDILFCFPE